MLLLGCKPVVVCAVLLSALAGISHGTHAEIAAPEITDDVGLAVLHPGPGDNDVAQTGFDVE